MDDASRHAAEFLRAVGSSRLKLAELSHRLESRPQVVRALYDLAPIKGAECLRIDGYVDAELRGGNAVAWLLDVTWDGEGWMVAHRLVVNDELGERVLREYPAAAATTLESFISQLEAATTILVGSADDLDLDALVLRSPIAQPR